MVTRKHRSEGPQDRVDITMLAPEPTFINRSMSTSRPLPITGDSFMSEIALWWQPSKLRGRHLASYLDRRAAIGPTVMPQREHPVEVALERVATHSDPSSR
jgi:hypothetical protein